MDYPSIVHVDQAFGDIPQLWVPRSFHSQQLARMVGDWTKNQQVQTDLPPDGLLQIG